MALLAQLACIKRYQADHLLPSASDAFYRFCEAHVLTLLATYRAIDRIVPYSNLEALHEQFSHDMVGADHSLEFKRWSALYHRHFESTFKLSVNDLVAAANVPARTFRRYVQDGVGVLLGYLRDSESAAAQHDHSQALKAGLPVPEYWIEPFGIDPLVAQVIAHLREPTATPFFSLEGMGGIGKTTIARRVAERLTEAGDFADLLWISAKQEWLDERGQVQPTSDPVHTLDDIVTRLIRKIGFDQLVGQTTADKIQALAFTFNSSPLLVVLDNLETLQEVQSIIPALRPLAGKSRFLVTSRHTLRHHSEVTPQVIPQLPLNHSKALFESVYNRFARKVGTSRLMLSSEEAVAIYETVGGVPLALRLLAVEAASRPLMELLAALNTEKSMGSGIEEKQERMFAFIYGQAWRSISDFGRELLVSMVNIDLEGASWAWCQDQSGLAEDAFQDALTRSRFMRLAWRLSRHLTRSRFTGATGRNGKPKCALRFRCATNNGILSSCSSLI